MPVATWGYGTGSTGGTARPFGLRIQGVDYIGSVPIDSISVSASVSSNATLTFTILDATGTLPVPQGWADVELVDYTEEEWIFGGLVMGVESSLGPPPVVEHRVRCVDYGILLDLAPVMADVTLPAGQLDPTRVYQSIAGAAPLGGVTVLEYAPGGHGRVVDDVSSPDYTTWWINVRISAETVTAFASARSALDSYSERLEVTPARTGSQGEPSPTVLGPAPVWVSPLKQLCSSPLATFQIGSAPLEVRQNPTTASHAAAEEISVDSDFRPIETGVRISDADTDLGGDNSGVALGAHNGYTAIVTTISRKLSADERRAEEGAMYVAAHSGGTVSGQTTVACAKNFQPGQALTVYYPDLGLDGTYAITAVSTRFLGGTDLMRQSTVQFNGERGTVARFNRTRFARAGVTT